MQEAYRPVLQIEGLNLFIPIQFLKIAWPTLQKLKIPQCQDRILRLKHPTSQIESNMGRITVRGHFKMNERVVKGLK